MNVRRARLRNMVEQLLAGAKVKIPPVPVDELIRAQGVEIAKKRFDDETSGLIYVDPKSGHAVIGLNVSHSKTRQRFTLAHELGHFLYINVVKADCTSTRATFLCASATIILRTVRTERSAKLTPLRQSC